MIRFWAQMMVMDLRALVRHNRCLMEYCGDILYCYAFMNLKKHKSINHQILQTFWQNMNFWEKLASCLQF